MLRGHNEFREKQNHNPRGKSQETNQLVGEVVAVEKERIFENISAFVFFVGFGSEKGQLNVSIGYKHYFVSDKIRQRYCLEIKLNRQIV